MQKLFFLARIKELRIELSNIQERINLIDESLYEEMDEDEFHQFMQEKKFLIEEQDRITSEIKKMEFLYLNY